MGIHRIVTLVLAPHFSRFSVGQYTERARAAAGPEGIDIASIDSWADEPALVEFLAHDLRSRLDVMPANTKVLFTAHSRPSRIVDAGDPYPGELRTTAQLVASAAGLSPWSTWALAWQSAGRTAEQGVHDRASVQVELGVADEAVADGRPAGLRGGEAGFRRALLGVACGRLLVALE